MVLIQNARISGRKGLYDLQCSERITSIKQVESLSSYKSAISVSEDAKTVNCNGNVVLPALCHSHLHLDKCFLNTSSLKTGSFEEALSSTTEAKKQFTFDDLIERGSRLIEKSIVLGVTSMRAHVEVDPTVNMKCLEAGLALKKRYAGRCDVQIAVFAQDPIFPENDPEGKIMTKMLTDAAAYDGVDAIGSAPYVDDQEHQMRNIRFIVDTALQHNLMLDFHLDYDLDPEKPATIFPLLEYLAKTWKTKAAITLGHVTKLTLFTEDELERVRGLMSQITAPIHFIGLPTSDVRFMHSQLMIDAHDGKGRSRKTSRHFDVSRTHQRWTPLRKCHQQLRQCLHPNGTTIPAPTNNQSSGDPLAMPLPIIYQCVTVKDLDLCYELVSTRSREAIGLEGIPLSLQESNIADLVILAGTADTFDATCAAERDRTVIKACPLH